MDKACLSPCWEGSYIDLRIIRALEATIRSSRVASPGIMSRSAAELNINQANAVHTNIVYSYKHTIHMCIRVTVVCTESFHIYKCLEQSMTHIAVVGYLLHIIATLHKFINNNIIASIIVIYAIRGKQQYR